MEEPMLVFGVFLLGIIGGAVFGIVWFVKGLPDEVKKKIREVAHKERGE